MTRESERSELTNELRGKVAFCTGAAGGIGFATATRLAEEGAVVYATDLAPGGTFRAPRLLPGQGEVRYRQLDVRDEQSISTLMDQVVAEHGRLDLAFNNAGILLPSLEAEWDVGEFQNCLDINVTGVLRCLKHELRVMKEQHSGAIVNTSSIGGVVGLAGSVAYSASKHAVVGMTKAAALEYAEVGVRINAVCPGPTDTPMTATSRQRRGSGEAIGSVPLGRSAQPEEIAEAVVWLLSEKASFVTGHALVIDGGFVAR